MKVLIVKKPQDKEICFNLREIVFVKEQNVPIEIEIDEFDDIAVHFLVINDSKPIGTGRIIGENNTGSIGRVAVLKEARGIGAGAFLMKEMISYCKIQDYDKIVLGAQEHAIGFYEKLGFKICSDQYMDANIPHYKMKLDLVNLSV